MQKLQQILQHAITDRLDFVDLTEGFSATSNAGGNVATIPSIGQIDASNIAAWHKFLFPGGVSDKASRGQIEIPGHGIFMTIATLKPKLRLMIFAPNAQQEFALFWEELSAVAPVPIAPPVQPAPPVVPPSKIESEMDLNVADMFSAPLAQPKHHKVANVPKSIGLTQAAEVPVAPVPSANPLPHDMFNSNSALGMEASIVAPAQSRAPASAKLPSANISLSADKQINRYLLEMLQKKASDLHITSGLPAALRIDGDIVRMTEWTWSDEQVAQLIDEICPELNRDQFERDNDTDFAYEISGVGRFRINLFRDRHGRGAVLRHIPNNIPTFEQLALPESLRKLCFLSKGLVVVTGPTGSGKSTTLAALVNLINEARKDHILTLEDPIEFVHPQKSCLIRQREIFRHTTSFARALKAALREDPDIILVGELRDLETTALAIEIAETGHLVLGTLHTTTATSTVDRIVGQFPADRQEQIRAMLAESLRGVVAQTLLKKVGGGRVAAHEILMVNHAVSAMIREAKIHMLASHMQSQKADGNMLMNESLINLVTKKLVLPKEAYVKALDKNNFIERCRAANVDLSWYQTIGKEAA